MFFKKLLVISIMLITPLAAIAEEGESPLHFDLYGGTIFSSAENDIEIDVLRLNIERCLKSPDNLTSPWFAGLTPTIKALAEYDFAVKEIKKAGMLINWRDDISIMFGQYMAAFTWETLPALKEYVLTGNPLSSLSADDYITGLHFIADGSNNILRFGYYGPKNRVECWQASLSQKHNPFLITFGIGQMPDRQFLARLVFKKNKLESEIATIGSDSQQSGYKFASAFRLTYLFYHWLQFYQQTEWITSKFSGVTIGGNLIIMPETKLMVGYTTSGPDQLIIRAAWYIPFDIQ